MMGSSQKPMTVQEEWVQQGIIIRYVILLY